MKVGVISDTHNVLNETAVRQLRGVDVILHAGDIGSRAILDELRLLAPVTCIRGNCDLAEWGYELPECVELILGGYRVFMTHRLGEGSPSYLPAMMYERWKRFDPQIAIFGHIHRPINHQEGKTLFFNPGSPTSPRGGSVASIGILHLSSEAIVAEHIPV